MLSFIRRPWNYLFLLAAILLLGAGTLITPFHQKFEHGWQTALALIVVVLSQIHIIIWATQFRRMAQRNGWWWYNWPHSGPQAKNPLHSAGVTSKSEPKRTLNGGPEALSFFAYILNDVLRRIVNLGGQHKMLACTRCATITDHIQVRYAEITVFRKAISSGPVRSKIVAKIADFILLLPVLMGNPFVCTKCARIMSQGGLLSESINQSSPDGW